MANSPSGEAFADQIHFNQVREALWHWPQSRASVMVGSGFSRNALKRRAESEDIPTWPDLARELVRLLTPREVGEGASDQLRGDEGFRDPLKLAQEYDDVFGRTALHRFLSEQVRDSDFVPGPFHRRLLALPWRDVFTTNWDTLLERCIQEHDLEYSVLERTNELPLELHPRIVKLHGSLPHGDPLISTDEDYRTYPVKFAPFVNLVQQSMMETTFVLLGFSGDDPNFQRWLGWVRDNLGEAAPKIYLAGWLGLRPSRRRSLELRNVVPVDFALHPQASSWPKSKRHERAMEWLLLSLERGRRYEPQNWPAPPTVEAREIPAYLIPLPEVPPRTPVSEPSPSSVPDETALLKEVERITEIWRHNRECYPGWLVLPFEVAREMRAITDAWEPLIVSALPHLADAAARLEVLTELVWRREVLLDPILADAKPHLAEAFEGVDPSSKTVGADRREDLDWETVTSQWKVLGKALVTSARQEFDRGTFDERVTRLSPLVAEDDGLGRRLHHEECLWALNRQDWPQLEGLLEQWDLGAHDHAWLLRKAALLAELNRGQEALQIIKGVLRGVRGWRNGVVSLAGPSIEAWALWMEHLLAGDPLRLYEGGREFVPYRCDLLDDLRRHESAVAEPGERSKPRPFGLGAVAGPSLTLVSSSGTRAVAALRAIRFSEVVGLPAIVPGQLGPMRLGQEMFGGAADALRAVIPAWSVWLAARCADGASDARVSRTLSRARIAFLPLSLVSDVAETQHALITRALGQIPRSQGSWGAKFWGEKLQAAMEVLSRCVVRLGGEEAEGIFVLAEQLYCDVRVRADFSLSEPLWNLLREAWAALPSPVQTSRVLEVLRLPVVGLDGFSADTPDSRFKDPAELLHQPSTRRSCPLPVRRSESEETWNGVVDLLDRALTVGGEARRRASLRLVVLAESGQLRRGEMERLAISLWGDGWEEESSGLPQEVGVRPWVFAVLPEPEDGFALARLRASWSRPARWQEEGVEALEEFLGDAGDIIGHLRGRELPVELSQREENTLRDAVEVWVATKVELPPFPPPPLQSAGRHQRATESVAKLLLEFRVSDAAARALGRRVGEQREKLVSAYVLVPGVLNSDPEQAQSLTWLLRLGLASTLPERVESAARGLLSWLEAERNGDPLLPSVPVAVLQEVGVIIANRRWAAVSRALQVAEWVFRHGTAEQRKVLRVPLLDGLALLREELVYKEDVDRHPFTKRPWVDHEEVDVPLLRWLCARTALAMRAAGDGEEPAVADWIKAAEEDPLPEMRLAMEEARDSEGPPESGEGE